MMFRFVLVALGLVFASMMMIVLLASEQVVWRSQCYGTLDTMTTALGQYREFHIVVIPSSRNALGYLGNPYCVVYR